METHCSIDCGKSNFLEFDDEYTAPIIKAHEKACPLTNPKPRNGKTFWNDELQMKKRGIWPTQQDENKETYKRLLKEYNLSDLSGSKRGE